MHISFFVEYLMYCTSNREKLMTNLNTNNTDDEDVNNAANNDDDKDKK